MAYPLGDCLAPAFSPPDFRGGPEAVALGLVGNGKGSGGGQWGGGERRGKGKALGRAQRVKSEVVVSRDQGARLRAELQSGVGLLRPGLRPGGVYLPFQGALPVAAGVHACSCVCLGI